MSLLFDFSTQVLPPIERILKQHAKLLHNLCNVPLGHGQEMVSYLYQKNSWGELIEQSKNFNDQLYSEEMQKNRKIIMALFRRISLQEKNTLLSLEPELGSISYNLLRERIDSISDLELSILNYYLFSEGWQLGKEQPIPWNYVLSYADNSFSSYIKRYKLKLAYARNPHISFPHFGISLYGYVNFNRDKLAYSSRELDSILNYRGAKYLFNRPWFVSYICGFIRYLMNSLSSSGISGLLAFSRIHNEGLIETNFSGKRFTSYGHEATNQPIKSLLEAMIDMGGEISLEGRLGIDNQTIIFNVQAGEKY